MCQCGCGDLFPVKVYEINKNKYVVISEYHGCKECAEVIAHDIYFYDKKGMEDIADWVKPEKVEFDEFGGEKHDHGLPLFDISDFREILEENENIYGKVNEYDSMADWFEENGLNLIQEAMRRFKEKHKPQKG